MNSDHRDPLHDSRNAMTEWERSLRPTRERHWAMWIALSALLLFGVYRGAEWLLAQRAASRPKAPSVLPSMPASPPTTGRVPPPYSPETRPENSVAPGTVEIIKCVSASGKSAYSDGPCPAGSVATTVRLRRDLNVADGMSVEARETSQRENAALVAQQQAYERQVAQSAGSTTQPDECSALNARVKSIDIAARQPQSVAMQDWLRDQRQQVRDRRFRLGCR